MSNQGVCPVCGNEAIRNPHFQFDGDMISCKQCGKFILTYLVEDYMKHKKIKDEDFFSCLYYYLLHYRKNSKPYLIQVKDFPDDDKYNRVTVDGLMNLFPKTMTDRINMVLLNFAKLSNGIGNDIEIVINKVILPFVFVKTHNEAEYILGVLNDMELITKSSTWDWNKNLIIKIQYKGWQRIDELQKSNETKNQGFIAMWFNADMSETEIAIKKAVENAHYTPMIIRDKEHNNQIVPEILYEIRNSDFLVADLTGSRGGVYYEAGYALALGKEVIVTVNETDDDPHFDVAQKNQVRYKTPEELTKKLTKRIIATVGDRNDKS